MSAPRDLRNAPLSVQAAQLKKSIQSRDSRRNAERSQRIVKAELQGTFDTYDDAPARRGPDVAAANASALAALSAISAVRQAEVIRCDLCQATFTTAAQYQQHVAGPVHRKAIQKQDAEQYEREHRARFSGAAEAAMAAAAWQGCQGQQSTTCSTAAPASSAGARPSAPGLANSAGQRRQPGLTAGGTAGGRGASSGGVVHGGRGGPAAPSRPQGPSHEQMVAAAQLLEEPLSIDGWVPPSIPAFIPAAGHEGVSTDDNKEEAPALLSTGDNDMHTLDVPEDDAGRSAQQQQQQQQQQDEAVQAAGRDQSPDGAGASLLGLDYSDDNEAACNASSEEDSDEPPLKSFF